MKQRLLVSVRGANEAVRAAQGGAHIADVEYPGSALGTPYPLNIAAVREGLDKAGFPRLPISTNIGEEQRDRAAACQAALGVASAGADIVKFGLAFLPLEPAVYLGRNLVRTVRRWRPKTRLVASVFADTELRRFFDPLTDGPELVRRTGANALLVDTLRKDIGRSLTDYIRPTALRQLADGLHALGRELWIAGSISREDLPGIWETSADVVCVRGAACRPIGRGGVRFGLVSSDRVNQIVRTIPGAGVRDRS